MSKRKGRKRKHFSSSVKAKPKKPFSVKKKLKDQVLQNLWDDKKSVRQNRSQLYIHQFTEKLSTQDYKPTIPTISEVNALVVRNLVNNHQHDDDDDDDDIVKAMVYDTKFNVFQWNQTQCQKMYRQYQNLLLLLLRRYKSEKTTQ